MQWQDVYALVYVRNGWQQIDIIYPSCTNKSTIDSPLLSLGHTIYGRMGMSMMLAVVKPALDKMNVPDVMECNHQVMDIEIVGCSSFTKKGMMLVFRIGSNPELHLFLSGTLT